MARASNNRVRIVGGRWRSRVLTFVDVPMLRPTPDRVRETLFNWLQGEIRNCVCLDGFAGTGALGFEALSRGAKHVDMLESSPDLLRCLKDNAVLLGADNVGIYSGHFPGVPREIQQTQYQVVFLDPPFGQGLVDEVLAFLLQHSMLAVNALIYVETEQERPDSSWPLHYRQEKKNRAGRVYYYLLRYQALNDVK
jgi:16S rRNA (guanine966-N2)-methyltransferase